MKILLHVARLVCVCVSVSAWAHKDACDTQTVGMTRLLIQKQRRRLHRVFEKELQTFGGAKKLSEHLWLASPKALDEHLQPAVYLAGARSQVDVIAQAGTPLDLLDRVSCAGLRLQNWTIEHECLSSWGGIHARGLACAIAQRIDGLPALTTLESKHNICVVETSEQLYLGFVDRSTSNTIASHELAWIRRPFVFSAALQYEFAWALLNWANALALKIRGRSSSSLYDPCVGSGTTLHVGAMMGMSVIGSDVQPRFVDQVRTNLQATGIADATVFVKDAALPYSAQQKKMLEQVECVCGNLPWNVNVQSYFRESVRILCEVAQAIPPLTPCVYITREPVDRDQEIHRWYHIVDSVEMPGSGKADAPVSVTATLMYTVAKDNSNS